MSPAPTHNIGSGPIEKKHREPMRKLAELLDEYFNGPAIKKRQVGFVLMAFPFDGFEGRCNYISNAPREDIVTLLREQHAYFTGAPDTAKGNV